MGEKEKFDKLDKKGKEEWMAEAKKDLKGEGMPDEDVEKAAEMFEKNDMDGLMKMKRKMEKKKKDGDKKLAKPMKGEKPVLRLVALSEEGKDESDDRKQMEEEKEKFDKLDKKGKEEWMVEAKKDLKGEGMSDEDVEKAAEMFEKNDMDGLMKMKRKMEKKKKDGDKKLAKPMKDE